MLNSLHADFFRIIKGGLCLYSFIGMIVLGWFFSFVGTDKSSFEIAQAGLADASMLIPIFLTNIFVIVWGHEFSYRVVNNSLVLGIKRLSFFMNKTILTFILTFLLVSVYTISLFMTTFILHGDFEVLPLIQIFLAQLPLYMTVSALGILLFNIIRATYLSVAIFVSVAFIGDSFISSIVATYFPNFEAILDTLFFTNIRAVINLSELSTDFLTTVFISGFAYMVLAVFISYMSFSTREFK